MKRIKNLINKKFILTNINQIDIFAKYLSINEDDIVDCIENNNLINSPIRVEDNASVGFRYNNKGSLKMRDFGGFFWGDCFDAVTYILNKNGYNLNVSSGDDFKFILNHIASTFGILNGVDKRPNIKRLLDTAKKSKKIITFNTRNWDTNDKKVWITKYHNLFSFDYLVSKNLFPVENYWVDYYSQPEAKYYYTRKDPCYAIYLGEDNNRIPNIRLYFPLRDGKDKFNPRFISNNNSFQNIIGSKDEYDYIVLGKSFKDSIAMERIFQTFSFTGYDDIWFIGYPSENFILTYDIVSWLLSKLRVKSVTRIINFTDFDRTGRANAYRAYDEFGIPFVFLTNGELGLPNYGAKDITDFIEKYKLDASYSIIKEYIKYYEENIRTEENDYEESPYF